MLIKVNKDKEVCFESEGEDGVALSLQGMFAKENISYFSTSNCEQSFQKFCFIGFRN